VASAGMSWWERNIVEPEKLPLLLLLAAFIVTFLATRVITRSIRAGRGPFRDVGDREGPPGPRRFIL
jgi:hypothetical protein